MIISFEGSEGVGKSSLISSTKDLLRGKSIKSFVVKEDDVPAIHTNDVNLLLRFAYRLQLLDTHTLPLRRDGCIVLYDRYIDSTYVYQGRNDPEKDKVDKLMSRFDVPKPDLCFVVTCDPEVAVERIKRRAYPECPFDPDLLLSARYLERLQDRFIDRARTNKDYPYEIIDNSSDRIDLAMAQIKCSLQKYLPL